MKKLHHTPGPWEVHRSFKQMVHNDKVQIANMGANSCFPVKRLSEKENEANAKLIAAAPELKERLVITNRSLKELIRNLPLPNDGKIMMLEAIIKYNQEAITKAEGR